MDGRPSSWAWRLRRAAGLCGQIMRTIRALRPPPPRWRVHMGAAPRTAPRTSCCCGRCLPGGELLGARCHTSTGPRRTRALLTRLISGSPCCVLGFLAASPYIHVYILSGLFDLLALLADPRSCLARRVSSRAVNRDVRLCFVFSLFHTQTNISSAVNTVALQECFSCPLQ